MGILFNLLYCYLSNCVLDSIANFSDASLARRTWGLHEFFQTLSKNSIGYFSYAYFVHLPVRKELQQVLRPRFHPTVRKLLRVHSPSLSLYHSNHFFVSDQFLADRNHAFAPPRHNRLHPDLRKRLQGKEESEQVHSALLLHTWILKLDLLESLRPILRLHFHGSKV